MAGYTQEFLVSAFMSRYMPYLEISRLEQLEQSAIALYSRVGRDRFREYACLDAEALRAYKNL